MRVILGSSSPRRFDLFTSLFSHFETVIPDIDETPLDGETPQEYAIRVAKEKAEELLPLFTAEADPVLLVTSDTLVTFRGEIFGKPHDYAHAADMLTRLQGNTHEVISSIALAVTGSNTAPKFFTGFESTSVTFKPLSQAAIEQYLNTVHYLDKAGSYAAQEYGDMIIEKIQGSMTNVIGFPLRLFFQMLSKQNFIGVLPFSL